MHTHIFFLYGYEFFERTSHIHWHGQSQEPMELIWRAQNKGNEVWEKKVQKTAKECENKE